MKKLLGIATAFGLGLLISGIPAVIGASIFGGIALLAGGAFLGIPAVIGAALPSAALLAYFKILPPGVKSGKTSAMFAGIAAGMAIVPSAALLTNAFNAKGKEAPAIEQKAAPKSAPRFGK